MVCSFMENFIGLKRLMLDARFYGLEGRASDFFQDWWAKVTNGAKNCGSFSEMMGPGISN